MSTPKLYPRRRQIRDGTKKSSRSKSSYAARAETLLATPGANQAPCPRLHREGSAAIYRSLFYLREAALLQHCTWSAVSRAARKPPPVPPRQPHDPAAWGGNGPRGPTRLGEGHPAVCPAPPGGIVWVPTPTPLILSETPSHADSTELALVGCWL